MRLGGRLDVEALGAALADVVGRHESLRTLFPAPDGIPQQVVVPVERADFGWQVVDAGGWPEARLREAIDAAVGEPFDLAARDPVAGKAFPSSARMSMCWWRWCTISPLMAGRSRRWCVIVGVAYAARCAGRAPGWAPLAVQYVDYTLWQRAQLGESDRSR